MRHRTSCNSLSKDNILTNGLIESKRIEYKVKRRAISLHFASVSSLDRIFDFLISRSIERRWKASRGVASTSNAFDIATVDLWLRWPSSKCFLRPPLFSCDAVTSFSNVVFTSTLKDHIIGGRVWRFGLITTLHQKGYPNFIVIKRSGLVASAKGPKIHENWNFLANQLILARNFSKINSSSYCNIEFHFFWWM